MIAIDTNVLLRRLIEDDAQQAQKVADLFRANDGVLVTDVVLVETLWVLKGKGYKLDKKTLCSIVWALLEEPNIQFESEDAVWGALRDYMQHAGVHYPDALIAHKSQALGASTLYSFDVKAQRLKNVTAP
ncbi:MAG: type II toxin-antitoxin system VapC family toxin [Oleiphilaceae bacterium]|nr:type II toxin-antitoxin system VapC family toxin [Oleiphilaceae bacterium]